MTMAETGNLNTRIKAVWRRHQNMHLSAGFLALCRWAIPMFLVAILIDRPTYLTSEVRAAIMILIVGVALYKAWRAGWRHLQGYDPTRAALQMEKAEGGLESLLVTAVQLENVKASDAIRAHIAQQANERAEILKPEKTVPFSALKKPVLLAGSLAAVLGVMSLLDGSFVLAGVQRIFTPWVPVEYPTDTKLTIDDPDMVVKQGDEARIEIQIGGVIPKQAKLSLKTGEGTSAGALSGHHQRRVCIHHFLCFARFQLPGLCRGYP